MSAVILPLPQVRLLDLHQALQGAGYDLDLAARHPRFTPSTTSRPSSRPATTNPGPEAA